MAKVAGQVSVDEWNEAWEAGRTGFHLGLKHHPKLERFLSNLVQGRKNLKFFFPLCGKAQDMKWMWDEGHTVVGVESSPKACQEFFEDNELQFSSESVDAVNGTLYKSSDGRIRLYCCDLFTFSTDVEKDFSAIFDRGSLVAINVDDRQRYADLLLSLMTPDARYMLLTFIYDPTKFAGPPHTMSDEEIDALFGSRCNIELLDVEDFFTQSLGDQWGIDSIHERVQLITMKQ